MQTWNLQSCQYSLSSIRGLCYNQDLHQEGMQTQMCQSHYNQHIPLAATLPIHSTHLLPLGKLVRGLTRTTAFDDHHNIHNDH